MNSYTTPAQKESFQRSNANIGFYVGERLFATIREAVQCQRWRSKPDIPKMVDLPDWKMIPQERSLITVRIGASRICWFGLDNYGEMPANQFLERTLISNAGGLQ